MEKSRVIHELRQVNRLFTLKPWLHRDGCLVFFAPGFFLRLAHPTAVTGRLPRNDRRFAPPAEWIRRSTHSHDLACFLSRFDGVAIGADGLKVGFVIVV